MFKMAAVSLDTDRDSFRLWKL